MQEKVPFESFTYPFFDLTSKPDPQIAYWSFLTKPHTSRGLRALYVHVPFCDTICSFCPFIKQIGTDADVALYLDALLQEIKLVSQTPRISAWEIDAIYIGGGTPSRFTAEQIAKLLQTINSNFNLKKDCEVSYEMEAKTVDEERMLALRENGVTRVSFGLQTYDQEMRKHLHLTATRDDIDRTVSLFSEFYANSYSADLMVGLPGQDYEKMHQDIQAFIDNDIDNISIYPLDYVMTLPGFLNNIREGQIPAPADALTRLDMFYEARKQLRHSYNEQNIYTYGKDGSRPTKYMFNVVYGEWTAEYIGVGAGAYSYINGLSVMNVPSIQQYIDIVNKGGHPIQNVSFYIPYEKGIVFFPKHLRYNMDRLEDVNLTEIYMDRIQYLIQEDYVNLEGSLLTLSPKGEKYYAAIMVYLFSDTQHRLYQKITHTLKLQTGGVDELHAVPMDRPKVKSVGAINAMGNKK